MQLQFSTLRQLFFIYSFTCPIPETHFNMRLQLSKFGEVLVCADAVLELFSINFAEVFGGQTVQKMPNSVAKVLRS